MVHLTNVSELMAKIAASPMAQQRYAERWTSYAYEREGNPWIPARWRIWQEDRGGRLPVRNLITDLTQTPQFRTRAVGASQ